MWNARGQPVAERRSIYRTLFDALPDAVLICDDDRRCLDANDAALKLLGSARADIIGRRYEDFTGSEGEVEIFRRDGTVRIVEFLGCNDPTTGLYLCCLRDVTDRVGTARRFEILMAASAVIANSLGDPVMLQHLANALIARFADGCIIALMAGPHKELEQVAAAHADPAKLPLVRALSLAPRSNKPELMLEVTDEIARALGVNSAMIVPLGTRGGMLGRMTFLSTRERARFVEADLLLAEKLAERVWLAIENARLYEAEKASRARSKLVADAGRLFAEPSLDLACVLDAVTRLIAVEIGEICIIRLLSEDGLYLQPLSVHHVDPGRRKTLTELLNQPWPAKEGMYGRVIESRQTLFVPVVGPEIRDAFPSLLRPSHDWYRPTSIVVVPILARGEPLGVLTTSRGPGQEPFTEEDRALLEDLGDRAAMAIHDARIYENEQRARKQAEEASRAKDQFLAMVSHELRTPLNAIIGWTHMLTSGAIPPEKQARALETIQRNAEAQAQLIEDLLDISRIITGKMRLEMSEVALQPIVVAAIEAIGPAATAKSIQITRAIDPAAGSMLGDADRLQQIVWNLLSNAVKFTPPNGRVHVSLVRSEQEITLSVEDDGRGIAPAFLPHLFERFRQADAGTTRTHGGLGLGLSIVRHLVELHGGAIEAKSDGDGAGSIFTVRLPNTAAKVQAQSAPEPRADPKPDRAKDGSAAHSLSGVNVIVVEDDADTRELLTSMLEVEGAVVKSAASAAQGIALLAAARPDVLICDIAMPEVDGYGFIARVRAQPEDQGGSVPAIALTAHARAEDRVRAIAAGFDVHLAKPVDPQELKRALARVVSEGKPAPKNLRGGT